MTHWPLNRLYFVIFLAIGFLGAVPFVLGVMGEFWWVSIPAIVVWLGVLWRWGLPFIAAPADVSTYSLAEKIVAVAIMFGQCLFGLIMAVFLIRFLIQQWMALILAILLLGGCVVWASFDNPKKAKPHPKAPTVDVGPPPVEPPAPKTLHDWILTHISVVVWLTLAVAAVAWFYRPRYFLPLAGAATAAYAAVIWIHAVSKPSKPGEPPAGLFTKILSTFMSVVMTIVGLIVFVVACEAVAEFWMWVAPPVAIVALFVVLMIRDAGKAAKAAAPVVHGAHKGHDTLVH